MCLLLVSGCSDSPQGGAPATSGRQDAPGVGNTSISGIIQSLEQRAKIRPRGDGGDTASRAGSGDSVVWDVDTTGAPIEKPEDAVIPEGQDPTLAEGALAAAFTLVRGQRGTAQILSDLAAPDANPPAKQTGVFRIALMLPREGSAAAVGRDIQSGAELAMFKLAPQHVDMVFLDTSGNLGNAIDHVASNGVDVVLGPLFSSNAGEVRRRLIDNDLPVISFSNDISIASPGLFLLGQTPEQEIDIALTHALRTTRPVSGRDTLAVAVLSNDSAYGMRVADRAVQILRRNGLQPANRTVFGQETVDHEETLRETVRGLAGWVSVAGRNTRVPPYDIVVLAGDVSFSLRVAPVLAWYDLNSETIRFVGTSLWAAPAILQEPSLKQGIFADASESRRQAFDRMWRETGTRPPGYYAALGFDAVALSAALSATDPNAFHRNLANKEGFTGFTGTFRFGQDGINTRLLDVLEISDGTAKVLAPAEAAF